MKKRTFGFLGVAIGWFLTSSCFFGHSKKVEHYEDITPPFSIYDISIKPLDGKSDIKLSDYKGKKMLFVNTASECGYTPQYADIQKFYEQYKDSVVVIGCPCNQFGGQEPGTAAEIGTFCKKNYGVTFILTEKIDVKGDNQHPLYQWLTQKAKNGAGDFQVKWNFNKFLVNQKGQLTHYFDSKTKPSDEAFIKAVKE